MPRNTPELLRAAWSDRYVVSERGCHEWTRGLTGRGYGQLKFGGKQRGAHRVAYELFVGPIPEGRLVRHRCDNRCCVNPDHLELGTYAENMQDKMERGRWRGGRKAKFPGPLWPVFLRRLNELGMSQARLAAKFGVDPSTISVTLRRARKDSQVS